MSHLSRWLRASTLPVLLVALVALSGAARAATFVVDSALDTNLSACTIAVGDCTLRGAINAANASTPVPDTITFDSSVAPTITLGSVLPTITDTLTITGPGASLLTVSGASGSNTFITGNNATSQLNGLTVSGGASAVGNLNGTVYVTNCTLSGNGNGIINGYSGSATLTVSHSTFSANATGISNLAGSTINAINCTFANNYGIQNGGIVNATNCTINGNTFLGIENLVGGTITIKNTLCAGNLTNISNAGTLTQQGNNILTGNPLLGALANNGGPTQTMLPLTNSPAIDQGVGSAPVTTDQRGQTRPSDDPGITNFVGGDGSDIGAVEVQAACLPPTLSISDATVTEGHTGSTTMTFTVCLSALTCQDVTVDFLTNNVTATAPACMPGSPCPTDDYVQTGGTLTIPAGQLCGTFTVTVNGDTLVECDETFTVDLSNATNATISDGQGVGTITNDDVPCFTISNAQVIEGNTGQINAVFTVCLSAVSCKSTSVNYVVSPNTANAADFDAASVTDSDGGTTPGVLTFPPNTLCRTITVPVNGDQTVELTENFFVDLNSPAGATMCDSHGIGTITNDDFPPCISISNVTVTEGNSGLVSAVFNVTLSTPVPAGQTISVTYAVTNGSATLAGADYTTGVADSDGGTPGTLTFTAGQTGGTITVPVVGDQVPELNENFFVDLSLPINATICDGHGIGTITNDDKLKLFVSDVQMFEGDVGNRAMYFTIALNVPALSPVTVSYSTSGVTNNSATAVTDYVAVPVPASPIVFAIGDTSKSVAVNIVGNTVPEADEMFKLTVTSAPGVSLSKPIGYGTIVNDDLPGIKWIANVSLSPINVASTVGVEQTFVTTYFNSTGNAALSDCRVRIGTATNDLRYDAATNKLYLWTGTAFTGGFAPGSTNTITGVAGTLNCASTQVVRSGPYVTVSWALTPNASLNGVHNIRMFCRNNDTPVLTAILETKGTWMQ